MATPQRRAAADVGSGAAAGCGAAAGDDIVGWWLVSASKKSWDELGDITVHKVRHFDWKGPEGFAFFLCRHSVQIVGWAGGFGVLK